MFERSILILIASSSTACFSTVQLPSPSGDPLPIAPSNFPHDALDNVVKKVVNDQGQVDYKALKADRNELEKYVVALAKTSPHQDPTVFPTREEALAYWINAYNAAVLFAVTERPQMRSVNDDVKNFFYFTEYQFGNEKWSLYKLENEVVRKEFSEPRIHFALNCASAGCPELPPEAFVPAKLEEQLAREAKEFCANEKKVRVDGKVVWVSQIFEWYADDFKADGGPIGFCKRWGRVDLPDDGEVKFTPYDWAMNAQPGKALFE
jgi:hypothetical protein